MKKQLEMSGNGMRLDVNIIEAEEVRSFKDLAPFDDKLSELFSSLTTELPINYLRI